MSEGAPHLSRESQEDLRTRILVDPNKGWAEFLETYGPLMRNVIGNFRLPPEDQQDVFQEVSHTLIKDDYRAIREWRHEKCPLPNYLAVITVRVTINFTKSAFHRNSMRSRFQGVGDGDSGSILDLLEQPTRTARDRLHRAHLAEAFKEILHRLEKEKAIREEDCRLLILRMNGLSYKEIEAILDISVETLTSRFARLKPILKNALVQHGITQADLFEV